VAPEGLRSRTPDSSPGSGAARCVVRVEFDGVQAAWLEAIAELHGCSVENVLREGLKRLSAAESVRIARTKRYRAIALAARAERFDPVSDYLAGIEPVLP
jgi:hypothetical protein